MAANHMIPLPQFTNLLTVQKLRPSNPIGDDKKMATPSTFLKFVGSTTRVAGAIVKRQERWRLLAPFMEGANNIDWCMAFSYSVKMFLETLLRQRVQGYAGPNVGMRERLFNHVVVGERNCFHGSHCGCSALSVRQCAGHEHYSLPEDATVG